MSSKHSRDGYPCLSISGARGMGKTLLAGALLRLHDVRRRLILDPLDEYDDYASHRVESAGALYHYLRGIERGDEFSIRYVPEDRTEPDAAEYLAQVAWAEGNVVLVMDEAHEAANTRANPEMLVKVCKRGRHRQVALWAISQRPSDIHPALRAELNASEAWVLRLAEWRDVETIRQRRGPELARRVASLPQFRAIRIRPEAERVEIWKVKLPDNKSRYPTLHRISGRGE